MRLPLDIPEQFMKAFGLYRENIYRDFRATMFKIKKLKDNTQYVTVDISNSSTTGDYNWYTSTTG